MSAIARWVYIIGAVYNAWALLTHVSATCMFGRWSVAGHIAGVVISIFLAKEQA